MTKELTIIKSVHTQSFRQFSLEQCSKASLPILSSSLLWCHNSNITTDLLSSSLFLKSEQRTLSSALGGRHGVSPWLWKYGRPWDESTGKILGNLDPCRAFRIRIRINTDLLGTETEEDVTPNKPDPDLGRVSVVSSVNKKPLGRELPQRGKSGEYLF